MVSAAMTQGVAVKAIAALSLKFALSPRVAVQP